MQIMIHKVSTIGAILLAIGCLLGCVTLGYRPTATPDTDPQPTATPPPATQPPATGDPDAVPVNRDCRSVIDGMDALRDGKEFPNHLIEGEPYREASDFDPNQYFQVLSHLSITPGYELDYLYYYDEMGGFPLLYARKSEDAAFQSFEEFLDFYGETATGETLYKTAFQHSRDYLKQIRLDGSPESYFEFAQLSSRGDQFYLYWHAATGNEIILCDKSDLPRVEADMANFDLEFSPEQESGIKQLDFTP
ncbi:MAG: hypothetical protein JXA21_29820 [Anaerolineae bacterium]|nr:hypothetical protein [Anaerolineae bacterium]